MCAFHRITVRLYVLLYLYRRLLLLCTSLWVASCIR